MMIGARPHSRGRIWRLVAFRLVNTSKKLAVSWHARKQRIESYWLEADAEVTGTTRLGE